jgi:hypothetical protein
VQRRAAEPPVQATVARVQQRLRKRAREFGVTVGFGEGRRATDVSLVVVRGPRLAVLRATPLLCDGLGLDVEVVRSAVTPEAYEVVVALMQPKRQRRRVEGERRASEGGGSET